MFSPSLGENIMRIMLALAMVAGVAMSAPAIAKHRMSNDEKAAQRCESFGFQVGTDGYRDCMMKLSMQMDAIDAQRRRAALAFGAKMLARNQDSDPVPSPSSNGTRTYLMNGRMVTCTTLGTVTNCF